MPLGLLAKDSIQDFQALGRDGDAQSPRGRPPTVVIETDDEVDSPSTHSESLHTSASDASATPSIQQAAPATANPIPTGTYPGFQPNYADQVNYQDLADRYRSSAVVDANVPFLGEGTEKKSLLCCLFPCFVGGFLTRASSLPEKSNTEETSSTLSIQNGDSPALAPQTTNEDDEMSSSSDVLGERLSDNERQAVLARLRLPTTATHDTSSPVTLGSTARELEPDRPNGLLNGLHTFDTSTTNEESKDPLAPIAESKPKGILKNSKTTSTINDQQRHDKKDATSNSDDKARRRSLFPTAAYDTTSHSSGNRVSFAPMARVVSVKSKNEMNENEKGDVWWQREDYEGFRRCGRIITRAMVEGGSEIWLTGNAQTRPSTAGDSKSESGDLVTTQGDKWWHTFGHSRRGLEHVVSMNEGRERQSNVRSAIRAVLEEQKMQRLCRREDAEKLRSVALKNTSWARDLAKASGLSDENAVKANFAEDRKSREFYLLKMARSETTDRAMPGFMAAPQRTNSFLKHPKIQLDNHKQTAAQIQRYRRSQEEKKETPDLVDEPLHDAADQSAATSMARLAAGFASDGTEKVNMAAVLSGMGAVAKERSGVTA